MFNFNTTIKKFMNFVSRWIILRIIITRLLKMWYYFKYPFITLKNDTSFTAQHQVFTLKGFASGFDDYSDNQRLEHDFLVWVNANIPINGIVSFDGDKYEEHSYTKIIPRLKQIRPDIQVVAFMQWQDSYSRANNWNQFKFPITFYLTPPFSDYKVLGRHAIAITGSKQILCLGGGPTVSAEFSYSLPNETWCVWNVTRPNRNEPTKRSNGSLFNVDHPELTHFL